MEIQNYKDSNTQSSKEGFDSIPFLITMSKTEMKTFAYNLRCFVTSALRACFHQKELSRFFSKFS